MNDAEILVGFRTLFEGRTDVYGDGGEGGCIKRTVSMATFSNHLFGNEPIGIYPLTERVDETVCVVRWGCTDIDTDNWIQARNLHAVFRHLGVQAWIEVSRSKGYHVWVFADGWVPAEDMRHMFLYVHEVAGTPATEVNPKQTSLENLKRGYGNYVRLPYPNGCARTGRQVVMDADSGHPLSLETFVETALLCRTPPDLIRELAQRYVPPPPRPRLQIDEYSGELEPLRRRLGGLANRIFLEGPLEGRDRSGTLSRLAYLMADEGELKPEEALALLRDADARWGKFVDRPDGEDQLRRIIEWAWATAR